MCFHRLLQHTRPQPRSEGCDVGGRAVPAVTEARGGVGAQQAEVLQQHTDLRVEVLCGELGVDWWTASRWTQVLAAADCLVATPMIILDALRHGYLRVGPPPRPRPAPPPRHASGLGGHWFPGLRSCAARRD